MTLGTTVTTNVARPTEVNRFTFTLTEERRVYFDSLTGDSGLSWELSGITGAIASSTFYSSDAADEPTERVINLAPGAYGIAVSGTTFRAQKSPGLNSSPQCAVR